MKALDTFALNIKLQVELTFASAPQPARRGSITCTMKSGHVSLVIALSLNDLSLNEGPLVGKTFSSIGQVRPKAA